MTARALTFGAVAAAYERYRPGYPTDLVDRVLGYVGRTADRALEIGAGTGKATRAFAGRVVTLIATDPDAAMLGELVRHVPPTVTTMCAAFEDLEADGSYDLVFAAAALHWTDPLGRWERMAGLLRAGGTFANFGGPVHLADPAIQAVADAALAPFLATDGVPSPDATPADAQL